MMDSKDTKADIEKNMATDNCCADDNSNIMPDDSKLRRKLLDDFVSASDDKMKVYLRIRPLGTSNTAGKSNQNCLHIQDDSTVVMHVPKDSVVFRSCSHDASKLQQKFVFSRVCGPEVEQSEFFNLTMSTPMKEFIEGQNWLIFAYGITNSGKTYTIKGTKSQPGVIPRAINVLFTNLGEKVLLTPFYKPHSFSDVILLAEKDQLQELTVKESLIGYNGNKEGTDDSSLSSMSKQSSTHSYLYSDDTLNSTYFRDQVDCSTQFKVQVSNSSTDESNAASYQIWVSYLEVYNEDIFDLLVPFATQKRNKLHLAQDKNGNTHVKGLCEVFVTSAEEAYQLLKLGQKNLRIASTKLNHQSSRSHSIFNIKIIRVFNVENTQVARINSLSFCDLAGSERCTKTKNSGERLKEAGNINTSLMVLGRCIDALRHNQNNKNRLVPFRDSKLTRIFQSFFIGRGQAAMIVNVNMCVSMFDETMNVMKFSAIANQVITVDHETSLSVSSTIVTRLTELWTRSSRTWSSIGKGREQKDSIVTIDESYDVIEEENEESIQKDKEIYEELINLVKYLEKELIDAKQQIATMETEIRAEVCQEYSELMAEMEEVYKENARKAEESAEEFMENRIKLLQRAMNKSIDSHYHDSSVTDSDESLSDKGDNPNSTICQSETTKENLGEESPIVKLKVFQELQEKLKKAEEEINSQETAFMKAGEIFTEKESEIDNLRDVITKHNEKIAFQEKEILNLQQQLKESQSTCEIKQNEISRLANRLKIVEGCEKASVSKNGSLKQTSLELQSKMKELEKQRNEIQVEYNNLKQEVETNKLLNMNQIAEIRLESSQNERVCMELRQKLSDSSVEIEIVKQKCKEYENVIEENVKEISNMKAKLVKYASEPSAEEVRREIEELKETNNALNSELTLKCNKILALNSKLLVADNECEKMKRELESLAAVKLELEKMNQRNASRRQNKDDAYDTHTISNKDLNDKQCVAQEENDTIENQISGESESQISLTSAREETNSDEEAVIGLKRSNLAQQLENVINDLNAANERNLLLKNETKYLRTEKEKFSILLSKAEERLRLMLYSDERDVMSLVQEMCLKWKAVNDLAVTLEKQLLFVTDELMSCTEKHKKEIKNFGLELKRKTEEIGALKMSIDKETKNREMFIESENKIKELKDALCKREEYINTLKMENLKSLHDLENNLKEKEEILCLLKTTLQEKSNDIETLTKEKDASEQERKNLKGSLDCLTKEYERLKRDMVNSLDNQDSEVTKLKGERDNLLAVEKILNEELEMCKNKITELDGAHLNSIKEMKSTNTELDFHKSEICKLRKERSSLEENVSVINCELHDCKKKVAALEKESGSNHEKVKRLHEEIEDLSKQVITLEEDKSNLTKTLSAANENLEDFRNQIQRLEEENLSSAEKVAVMNKELENLRDSFSKNENEKATLKTLREELNITNRKLEEMNDLKAQEKAWKDRCSSYSKELEETHSELETLRCQLISVNEKWQNAENELLATINEKKEIEERLKTSNKDAKALGEALTTRLQEIGEEVETWKKECNRLLLVVDEKETTNSKLKSEFAQCELKWQQLEETMAEKFDKDYVELLQEQIAKKDARLAMCTCNSENVETTNVYKEPSVKDVTENKELKSLPEKEQCQRSRQVRGRGRKCTNVEASDNENDTEVDTENSANNAAGSKRRKTRGAKTQKRVSSLAELEDFKIPTRRQTRRFCKEKSKEEEEKMSPLRRVGDYLREKSPVLAQLIRNTISPGNSETDEITSEPPAKPQERRKRKPLFSTDNLEAQLFNASSPQEEKSPHMIVTRQLRSRRKKQL